MEPFGCTSIRSPAPIQNNSKISDQLPLQIAKTIFFKKSFSWLSGCKPESPDVTSPVSASERRVALPCQDSDIWQEKRSSRDPTKQMRGGNKDPTLLYCVSSKLSFGDNVIVVGQGGFVRHRWQRVSDDRSRGVTRE